MVVDHSFYMNLAINEAWKYQILTSPNPAVGAVVLDGYGKILSIKAHKKAGFPHAEVNALQSAFSKLTCNDDILKLSNSHDIHNYLLKNHNNVFTDCSIYVTLEPCSHVGRTPSCATLLKELGIKKVYIGVKDLNPKAANGADMLKDVEFGLCKGEAENLLIPFKSWQDKRFVFFKWAMRLDGSVDGGVISSQSSRIDVHMMRSVCDLLIIGGNTVRTDRPTLDARLVDGKAPDVLIYSKKKEFDKDIPLFNVNDRKVFISDNFDIIDNYKNIMIEGGSGMFEATKDIVDIYLAYEASSTCRGGVSFCNSTNIFETLHVDKSEDIKYWLRRR
jgi:diaminohydroxyphosphoribosylaminopyrimidine deaminase/5-amino-6-(5-phosphoribosylamino)uracil reductase